MNPLNSRCKYSPFFIVFFLHFNLCSYSQVLSLEELRNLNAKDAEQINDYLYKKGWAMQDKTFSSTYWWHFKKDSLTAFTYENSENYRYCYFQSRQKTYFDFIRNEIKQRNMKLTRTSHEGLAKTYEGTDNVISTTISTYEGQTTYMIAYFTKKDYLAYKKENTLFDTW